LEEENPMKKKNYTMKHAYITAAGIIIVLIVLQMMMLFMNNKREAKNTTNAYLRETETIIEKNREKNDFLLTSLKEDYVILAKAVSYYLDHNTEAVYDVEELNTICSLMSIDEIHIFDEKGTIISGTKQDYIGYTFESGEQIRYFLPMLNDKSLTMCQDITPNTAEGKPMVYAITWNEYGTRMVQVGIESVRLLKELESNTVQATIDDIALDENMNIIVADASTLEVVGAKDKAYIGKKISDISNLDLTDKNNVFSTRTKLEDQSGYYYSNIGFTKEYCICVFWDRDYFGERTIETITIVCFYLLVTYLIIMLVIRRLLLSREENYRHLQVFESMSEIYYSLHLVNLKKNTVMEYSSKNQVKKALVENLSGKADEIMVDIMKATMSDEYLERGLEFSDMRTVAERMRDKKIISMELLGKNVGWIRMSFIAVETEGGIPVKIIVATQIIDEEKKITQSLFEKSYVDELTGCFNRRAYNSDVIECFNDPEEKDWVYVSIDVNGLKTVNDNLGHEAGDELLIGAATCMKNVFSKHGKIYRNGGDEFIGLIYADGDLIRLLCEEFEEQLANWNGELIKTISVSYGYVLSDETEGMSIDEIAELADKRMYEAKEAYYKKMGIERRRT